MKSRQILMFNAVSLVLGYLILIQITSSEVEACGPGRSGYRRGRLRRLVPLVQHQCVPNVGENSLGASGLPEGPIRKNQKRFRELVQNLNPDIVFRDDEGNGADRMMTQRLKEKLSILAISVMNQWPNIKLRVIEGWDDGKNHPPNSLHYEGRAVDITTSDKDQSKYGMLARLAVEAGFEWVHYESRSHIHCSVKSERADIIRNNGCFDGASIVETPDGPMEISQLQINDLVLTMNPFNGRLHFSPVIMWLDRDELGEDLFVELKTKSNLVIRLTSSHLIYLSDEPYDLNQFNYDNYLNEQQSINSNHESKQRKSSKMNSTSFNNLYSSSSSSSSTLSLDGKVDFHDQVPKSITNKSVSNNLKQNSNQIQNQLVSIADNRLTIDDLAFITYARNAVVGQYLLVNSQFESSKDTRERSSDEINVIGERLHYDIINELDERAASRLVFESSDTVQKSIRRPKPKVPSRARFEQIVSVNFVTRKGIHAPLTREGNIVVNSVVASCYAMINDHEMAHIAFAPIRWYSYIHEWLFGLVTTSPSKYRTVKAITERQLKQVRWEKEDSISQLNSSLEHNLLHQRLDPTERKDHNTRVIHWYPMLLYRVAKFILPTRYLF